MKTFKFQLTAALSLACVVGFASVATAEDAAKPVAAPAAKFDQGAKLDMPDGSKGGGKKNETDGRYTLPDGTMTFNIAADGTVDWFTYSGYKRYHSECHVCHGPHAGGSTFAPALKDSLKVLDYTTFVTTVMSGRIREEAGTKYVMPQFGANPNVACFIDDLYAYIRAVAVADLPYGRPEKREKKTEATQKAEDECFNSLTPKQG